MDVMDLIYENLFKKYNGEFKDEYDVLTGSSLSYKGTGYSGNAIDFLKDVMNVVEKINRPLKIEVKILVNVEE